MALAILYTTDGQLKPITPEKAVDMWLCLNGHKEPTKQQEVFLHTVKDLFIPPSYQDQAIGYVEAHSELKARMKAGKGPKESHLTHEGRLQGRSEQLPVGDR